MSAIPVHRFPPRYGPAPKLKHVEVRETVGADGQKVFAVRAPGSGDDQVLMLSSEALAIAGLFDGTRDIRGVQLTIHRQYGELLYVERIHELANALDRAGLFEGREKPHQPEAITNPGHRALRAPAHAGTAYDADPDVLRANLDSFFTHPEGPGALPTEMSPQRLAGVVAPHLDLQRGGPVYAHAYKALAEGTDADLFVIFGTAHASPEPLFTLTRAHYDTPFGPLMTDAQALATLEQQLGARIYEAEDVHREEHSIEFQAVFLKYLYGDRPITILPILCSTLYPCALRGSRPDAEPEVQKFLAALAQATAGRNVFYIGAADLSHVGTLYGDATAPTARDLEALGRRDRDSLQLMSTGNADAFFDHVGPDGDTRRICGLTPIWMTLRMTGNAPGKVLKYAQWNGAEHGAAVTYAAATILSR